MQHAYRDGACFVPLAAICDPALVIATLLSAFGITDVSQQPPNTRLIGFLRRKEMLVVLDNFEQILAAAPFIAEVLAACPDVRVLVTSRERLHLRAEQRYPVPPLADTAAVELFVACAQAVEPAFALTSDSTPIVHTLCQQLDCLPLAIELIAAHSDALSPQTMLTRFQAHKLDVLDDGAQDMPERHRTLRQAIEYSYDLLEEPERRLFRTLGVFVDGFDLAAVRHFGFDAAAVKALLNKSLVHSAPRSGAGSNDLVGERRFLLLETLRAYAGEQLAANHEADLAYQQHAAYYVQLAEMIELKLDGAQIGIWLPQLEIDHNNIRAALAWALETGDMITALRLGAALSVFWDIHGHVHEGQRWLEQALATTAPVLLTVRAKALSAAGRMAHILGNHARAQMLVEQSIALYRALQDQWGVASRSMQLGGILRLQGQYEQAALFYQQSFDGFQALGDNWGLGIAHIALGNLAMNHHDYQIAQTHYERGLALQRTVGDQTWIMHVLVGLTALAFEVGEYQRAVVYSEELLALAKELGNSESMVVALTALGRNALHQGDYARATGYLTQGFALAQELDYPPLMARVLTQQGDVAFAQTDLLRASRYHRQSLQIAHQLMDNEAIASGLERLAGVASAQADAESAIRLLGAAECVRARMVVPVSASEQSRNHQIMAAARAQLGDDAFAAAWAAGQALTLEQAVAFALAEFAVSNNNANQS